MALYMRIIYGKLLDRLVPLQCTLQDVTYLQKALHHPVSVDYLYNEMNI